MSTPAVTIVTGASKGIGLATAKRLLAAGACVVGVARSPPTFPAIAALAQQHPSSFKYVQADVCAPGTPARLVDAAVQTFGGLDGVVFNAGVIDPIQRIDSLNMDAFRTLFEINVTSVMSLAQATIPHLRNSKLGGRMIFVSSGAATNAYEGWAPYCISKSALNMFVSVLAKEEPTITSISLRPGVVNTPMQDLIRSDPTQHAAAMTQGTWNFFKELYEGGKLLDPDVPAEILAGLVLGGGKELSGVFLSWDDARLAGFRR